MRYWPEKDQNKVPGDYRADWVKYHDVLRDLYWMAVDPDVQRAGLGTLLVREMERSMRAEGGRIVRIETSSLPEYEKTRAFYRRIGYPETVRVKDFYWEGNDLCVHFGEIPRE